MKQNFYIGIDLGKNMAIGIVSVPVEGDPKVKVAPTLIDSIFVDLSKGEGTKDDDAHIMAYRFERVDYVVRSTLEPYMNSGRCWIGVEKPPVMFNQPFATTHLQGYFAIVILALRQLGVIWDGFAVSQWKACIDANVTFKSKTQKKVRTQMSKERVAVRVKEILGVTYPGEDDRVDAIGIALACATKRGGLRV